jgi:hypothetical protein
MGLSNPSAWCKGHDLCERYHELYIIDWRHCDDVVVVVVVVEGGRWDSSLTRA